MDRSQEKVISSKAQLQALDQSANIHQKVHDNQTGIIGVNRVAQRKISSDSAIENLSYIDARNGNDGLNNRKAEQLISPLQAQYFHPGVGMGLPPYLSAQAMDHRFYRCNPQMPVYPTGYTVPYPQRVVNDDEARETSAGTKASERSDRDSGNEPKEPIRTESVIKIATERTDARKQNTIDKRQSRPTNDEYTRTYQERNGDHVPYRSSRDKSDMPSNGDSRHPSNVERTLSDFRPYSTSSVNTKGMIPGSYGGQKSDYGRAPSTQANMFSSMPKLTPIAPRGHPSSPFSSAPIVTDSRSSTDGPSVRPTLSVYHSREYPITTEAMVPRHGRPEDDAHRVNYFSRSVYENFPGYWERDDVSRYPGHSAYQGYGYPRTMHAKRPEDKENVKEHEGARSTPRQIDSVREASISPERTSRYPKENTKVPESTKERDHSSSQMHAPAETSQNEQPSKNQVTLSKSEKPVLPENLRYKVNDEKKNGSKSDKVTVYPKQGMAYVVSVRETPHTYYSNGGKNSDAPADSIDRPNATSGFEPAVLKKDDTQRSSAKDKSSDIGDNSVASMDPSRRRFESSNNERNNSSNYDDSKKANDRNNNSSFKSYSRYHKQNVRSRPSNKITLGQDKVFVPPNITFEMIEKREQELERAAAASASDSVRSSEQSSANRTKTPGKKDGYHGDDRRQSPEQTRQTLSKQETNRNESSTKSSDDEELKIVEERVGAQTRTTRNDDPKRTLSPSKISRLTSPNVTSALNNPQYLSPFGGNFTNRRTPSENEMIARENAERSLQAAYLYGGNLPFQANPQFMAAGGRGDMAVMMPTMEMLYAGGMYKHHMMDPAAQGGAVMQDPLTGSLVVVPEALLNQSMLNPLAAAEPQLMLDPRFWGMQASMEDPRWQQFHQQQNKHLYEQVEKYKHEMMLAQQQGRWQGYPAFYPSYQKHLEELRKEGELVRVEQRPKSREEPPKQRPDKPDEPKDKPPVQTNERASSFHHEPRHDEQDKSDTSGQRIKPDKPESICLVSTDKVEPVAAKDVTKPVQMSEVSEKRSDVKERSKQEDQTRQFQQYMLRDPVPFSRIPAPLPKPLYSPTEAPSRDHPRDSRDIPFNPSKFVEVTRPEVSPQVVSAAATLATMDMGTRFPFNQQSFKQPDERLRRGPEQVGSANRKVLQNDLGVKGDNVPTSLYSTTSERNSPDRKMEVTTTIPRRTSAELSPPFQVNNQPTPMERHPREGFDILSLIRDKPRKNTNSITGIKNDGNSYRHTVASEPSRLLVAKAEKLAQDEELEVIRIDTPYVPSQRERENLADQAMQNMDFILSMSKELDDTVESPSSKSEIFWIECSEGEEDFEVQTINESVRPMKVEINGHNKENSIMLSLQSSKSEEQKKIIREKIEKLREIAKRRTREERFTALTRQKELKSPAAVVNNVTASLNEALDTNVMEKDIRMRLAELQKKYREKHRELARLQPRGKHGNEDHAGGKSTPIKRGPGRPRKRKYFGASSKSGKTTPTLLFNDNTMDSTTFKSGASSPSCPQSPGLKSVTSEDLPVFKETVDLAPVVKKKKKKKNVKKEESQPPSSSPTSVSPTTETKPRVKTQRRPSSSSSKSKAPCTVPIETSNMDQLISAMSPMFDDNSNLEPATIQPSPITTITAPIKPKATKKPKKVKKEKPPSTGESIDAKGSVSSELSSPKDSSPTTSKVKKSKSPKKSKKKSKTPPTPKVKSEFTFPETVNNGEQQESSAKKKEPVKKEEKEKKPEQDRDLVENDDVFTSVNGCDALDMLADFASSASFEKEKQPEKESPSEGPTGKGIKRGRPKKPYSPTPESDSNPPKKKKKKKKLPTPGFKSPKKSSTSSEEKENIITPPPPPPPLPPPPEPQPMEQLPSLPPSPPVEPTEVKEEPKPEPLEEEIVKVVPLKEVVTEPVVEKQEEEEEVMAPIVEPEREVTPPPEPIKEKRRKSRTSLAKELDETKQIFAMFGDVWQPRRSERIFINSSVTPQSSADLSPLSSPTAKTGEFGWPKKVKKVSKGKKPSKSDDVSDTEPTEEESPVNSNKAVLKIKKKKSPVKGKKRRSSSTTDPDFVLKTPKRKAAKRDRSYNEDADEDDDEDMLEEGDENQEDDIEDAESLDDVDEEMTEPTGYAASKQESHDPKPDQIEERTENQTSAGEQKEKVKNTGEDSSSDTEEECSKKDEKPIVEDETSETNPASGKQLNKGDTNEEETKEEKDEKKKERISTVTLAECTSSDETTVAERNDLPPEPVIMFTNDELKYNTKMLLPVDRVFFRGRITFYQEPDLYGIVLPGERGRRPHLRSTEQLLSQAVKDVVPPAVEYLPVGTRVCAHWSPQYRCFYPGSVIETPTDEKSEVGKLWVEFDDGDSGIFPLSDLRKIITEGPVHVEDVESDVVLPERRPHVLSSRGQSPSRRRSKEQETTQKKPDGDTSGWDSTEDAPIRRTRGRGKRRTKRDRRLSEEATDSDAPRRSQDTDDEDTAEQGEQDKKDDNDDDSKSPQSKKSNRRSTISREDLKNQEEENAVEDNKKLTKDGKETKAKLSKNQDDDTDEEEAAQEPGTLKPRARSSRLSDLDLRKKSLTLNINTLPRSRVAGSESPSQDSTSQDDDSGSCSEVFDDSPLAESKKFQPRLGKRRRSALDKNRQEKPGDLWTWSGKNHQNKRKGKGRKVFYKTIIRGDENISVGDCAVFTSNPSKSNNLPYVGKIESMWEGCSGNMVVRVKWFYHPEETKAGRRASDSKRSLYRSTHVDENDVQTISHKCEVVSPDEYKKRTQDTIGTRSTTTDRSDRLFTCVGTYDPSTEKIDH